MLSVLLVNYCCHVVGRPPEALPPSGLDEITQSPQGWGHTLPMPEGQGSRGLHLESDHAWPWVAWVLCLNQAPY